MKNLLNKKPHYLMLRGFAAQASDVQNALDAFHPW